jgi:hypothetical protein
VSEDDGAVAFVRAVGDVRRRLDSFANHFDRM